jgi:purine-binding chemotaxis protein CheW
VTAANTGGPNDPETQAVLTFELGNETYGVDILRVREIRGWGQVTKIPHAPMHVLGVLNLRGSIVPVIDLRMRFELERAEYTKITVIIVLWVSSSGGRREVGVVVDGVTDVVTVDSADVKQAPELGTKFATEYIRGLVPVAGRMVVLLDIDRLIDVRATSVADDLPTPVPAVDTPHSQGRENHSNV